jgi:hypothetical protein
MRSILLLLLLLLVAVGVNCHEQHAHEEYTEESKAYRDADALQTIGVKIDFERKIVTMGLDYFMYLMSQVGGVPFVECRIAPTFDGYETETISMGEGTAEMMVIYTWWGYTSDCTMNMTLPKGPEFNHFHPLPGDKGQPSVFSPGVHKRVLKLPLEPGITLSWDLRGPNRHLGHACAAGLFKFPVY